MIKERNRTVSVQCGHCHNKYILRVNNEDMKLWQRGGLIQNVMPYLSLDDRELLMSGTCGKCWDKMFREE